MTETEKVYSLQGLNDFLGDALSDEEITPKMIADSLKKEIRELRDYHEQQACKCARLLEQIGVNDTDKYDSIKFPSSASSFPDYMLYPNMGNARAVPDTISFSYGADTLTL